MFTAMHMFMYRCARKNWNVRTQRSFLEHCGNPWGTIVTVWIALDAVWTWSCDGEAAFFLALQQKCDSCISTAVSIGIGIIAGPDPQVRAI